MHGFDVDDRLRRAYVAVITGELSERTFLGGLAGVCEALNHNLSGSGNRQAHKLGFSQLYRATHQAAGDIELGLIYGEALRSNHEQHRIDAVGAHYLAGFALRPPCLTVEPTMLAGRAVHGDPPWPLYHLAVDPDIEAAACRIACKGHIAGTDIAATVAGPEFRRWKPGYVDLLTTQNDLVDGRAAFVDVHRGDAAAHDRARRHDHVTGRERGIEADRKCVPLLAGAEHIAKHPRAELAARKMIEQQRRRLDSAAGKKCDGGKFFDRIDGRTSATQPARGFDQRQPLAQVAPCDSISVSPVPAAIVARNR